MQDFDLYLPTHIVFGKGRVAELGKLTTGRGERVLITEFPAGSPGLEPREECGKFCDGLPFLSEGITLTACLGCALILIGIAATDSGLQKKD